MEWSKDDCVFENENNEIFVCIDCLLKQSSYKETITNDVEKKSETLLKTRYLICGQCGGSGRVLGFMDSPMECPDCHGDGIQQ